MDESSEDQFEMLHAKLYDAFLEQPTLLVLGVIARFMTETIAYCVQPDEQEALLQRFHDAVLVALRVDKIIPTISPSKTSVNDSAED